MDQHNREWEVMTARRVTALLHYASPAERGSKRAAIMNLLSWQPLARGIRFEGKCVNCKQDHFMSYIHPRFHDVRVNSGGQVQQECGYYCSHCQFGNAGSREVKMK